MKEILDILVWIGFIYVLFIFVRGMNDTQVKKHKSRLEEQEKKEEQEKNKEE